MNYNLLTKPKDPQPLRNMDNQLNRTDRPPTNNEVLAAYHLDRSNDLIYYPSPYDKKLTSIIIDCYRKRWKELRTNPGMILA